ncbi:MAG: ABC-F family ATP-binding cassette domain-containing protein [Bacilli bacterium]|nr:ABC-F family ATP-binding cassette domain-containing protein [Bacilli bacterium]
MIVNKLNKSFCEKQILNDISFNLNNGDKVCLVGNNGAGKSTLLKILSGYLEKDSGSINLNNETIKLLDQEIDIKDYDLSIIDFIKIKTNISILEEKLNNLESNLNESNMEEYGSILDLYLKLDGYNFENNINMILSGLDFSLDLNQKIKTLSGGEKIKVLLAVLLLSNPDIMLLDEPTNNLDIDAIEFLENYLSRLDKKMIIVSHDEEFLNNISSKIFELENGNLKEYKMPYYEYIKYKDDEYNRKLNEFNELKEKKQDLKNRIKEKEAWSNKGTNSKKKKDNDKIASNFAKERTKKTSGEISKLNRELEKIGSSDFKEKEEINFDINFSNEKGNKDIIIEDLVCGYDLFKTHPINLNIPFGLRVSISGKNGAGKSTFIKTLLSDIEKISGNISIGSEVKFGYISQDTLISDTNKTIYEYLTDDKDDINKGLLFTILSKFNIAYEDRNKKYSSLSPGERTRVNLAKLSLDKVNVLVLDEVTNHLDMEALNLIYSAVIEFKGTIISISHNRKFNEILSPDIIYNISDGKLTYKECARQILSRK